MNKSWIVVGISGTTNSGKSTLASFLQKSFAGSAIVSQDKYFRSDESKEHVYIPELGHNNWEKLEAVNWGAMMDNITQVLRTEPSLDRCLLIIEGHIIFNYEPIRELCRKKYFLKLDNKDECYRRRCTRVYDPPDIPGYFEKCVWPMYLSNLEEVERKCKDVMYLDGMDTVDNICEKATCDLKNYLSKEM